MSQPPALVALAAQPSWVIGLVIDRLPRLCFDDRQKRTHDVFAKLEYHHLRVSVSVAVTHREVVASHLRGQRRESRGTQEQRRADRRTDTATHALAVCDIGDVLVRDLDAIGLWWLPVHGEYQRPITAHVELPFDRLPRVVE